MDWSDLALSAARGGSLAAVLSAFGTAVFARFVRPGADVWQWWGRASVLLALGLTVVWLTLQAGGMAGAASLGETLAAMPTVALHTRFGHFALARLMLLAVVWPFMRPGWIGLGLTGLAVLVQAGMGHAAAMGGGTGAELVASECLHLLAAGAWLGGLVPLLIVLRRGSAEMASAAARDFTPVGLACVVALAGTGLLQAWELIGGLAGLVGTSYGRVASAKIVLFALLLGLAAANRLVFTERLGTASSARARLIASVATETALGLLVVLAAGRLASLAPGIHEQPTWPFAVRPSLDAFAEPDLVRELGMALAGLALALGLIVAAIRWRKARWPGLAIAAVLAVLAVPHLDLLFVEAYPSSFYTSPTEFGDSGIVHGARVFAANCAACHGADGHGRGAAADLTAEHLWAHSDGDLFWWVSHGIANPEGGLSMPGFAGTLSSDARWDVLDYVHALNAGDAMRMTGAWPHNPPAPQFDAVCADGRHVDMDDMRGRDLLVVAGDVPRAVPPGLAVIQLDRAAPSRPGVCVASGAEMRAAFAILLGVTPDRLAGAQILADRDGWLRARALPGVAGGWIGDNVALARLVADIDAHPVRSAVGHHHH